MHGKLHVGLGAWLALTSQPSCELQGWIKGVPSSLAGRMGGGGLSVEPGLLGGGLSNMQPVWTEALPSGAGARGCLALLVCATRGPIGRSWSWPQELGAELHPDGKVGLKPCSQES